MKKSTNLAKIKKINAEIDLIDEKTQELAVKKSELIEQKTEAENLEIIGAFRKAKISMHDISSVITQIKAFKKAPKEEQ